jgi:enolase-phosphatase E1
LKSLHTIRITSLLVTIFGILLDIEGTTSSISFVHNEMFWFVRRHLSDYLASHADDAAIHDVCDMVLRENGCEPCGAGRLGVEDQLRVQRAVRQLMDRDAKATGLKQLQGMVWKTGFQDGRLRAHLYPDVAPALRRWRNRGYSLRIYSSGSVQAQKLFLAHTIQGDLLELFDEHYDTTTGGKKDPESYVRIAKDWDMHPDQLLFISDSLAELDAARLSGYRTLMSSRPDNPPCTEPHTHSLIKTFAEVQFEETD